MFNKKQVYHLVSFVLLVGLLVGPVQPPATQARVPAVRMHSSEFSGFGPYRTRVTFPNSTSHARLDQLGVVVLDEGLDWALLLADADQLADLVRLRFQPRATGDLGLLVEAHAKAVPWLAQGVQPVLARVAAVRSLAHSSEHAQKTAQANLRAAMHALTPEQQAGIASLTTIDDDGDGLTNTEEQWWCTDPNDANSDGDAQEYSDGEEVYALLDFTLPRTTRWNYGPPFGPPNAWPDWNGQDGDPATPACNDGDFDTIPDMAEAFMVGTRVGTGDSENTDGDKFDDGQELFGTTYCPGGDAYCGYGNYPRTQDYSFISNGMPSWVTPPGDSPFVAAYPVIQFQVDAGSIRIVTKKIHTVERTITTGEDISTGFAETEGKSTTVGTIDTNTHSIWQENSTTEGGIEPARAILASSLENPGLELAPSFPVFSQSQNAEFEHTIDTIQIIEAAQTGDCECVGYIVNRYSLKGATGHAKDMGQYLSTHGFSSAGTPRIGAIVIFQPAFGSAINQSYGHVGVIAGVEDQGDNWHIQVRGANQPGGNQTEHGCTNVINTWYKAYSKAWGTDYISYWVLSPQTKGTDSCDVPDVTSTQTQQPNTSVTQNQKTTWWAGIIGRLRESWIGKVVESVWPFNVQYSISASRPGYANGLSADFVGGWSSDALNFSDVRSSGQCDGSPYGNGGSGTAINDDGGGSFSRLRIWAQTHTAGEGYSTSHSELRSETNYREVTRSQVNTLVSREAWATATTVDPTDAAQLTFDYYLRNVGSDAAVNLTEIDVNSLIGDLPVITWRAPDRSNILPGQTKGPFGSDPLILSLEQLAAIDNGAPIRVVLADYGYDDQLYDQNAWGRSVLFHVDDGIADDDDLSVDTYLIATQLIQDETYQDTLARYFDVTVFDTGTDDPRNGTITSIRTPEFDSSGEITEWLDRPVNENAWWEVSISVGGETEGIEHFRDMPAKPRTDVFLRYLVDSDGDGYTDRAELETFSDPYSPNVYPQPVMIAAQHIITDGNTATVQLGLQNDGNFDASSVEVWAIAPNDSITITDNLIGGGGRVRAGVQIVIGARIGAPDLTDWITSTAKPYLSGQFEGLYPKTYAFRADTSGATGSTPGLTVSWTDDRITWTPLDVGDGYTPGEFLDVADGVKIAFTDGTINGGDTFEVETELPIDTFSFEINRTPYTPPLIVVSYNDPQGNHKFTSDVELAQIQDDLTYYQGQMRHGVQLDVMSTTPFTPGVNTAHLIFNNPSDTTITEGKFFVEFATPDGTVAKEYVLHDQTFYPGPNVVDLTWDTAEFSPTFDLDAEYAILAFATDRQGTIIENTVKDLDQLGQDKLPQAVLPTATWDFGTVTKGQVFHHTLDLANTGFLDLLAYVSAPAEMGIPQGHRQLRPADVESYEITLDTGSLPTGPYSETITIRASDPEEPGATIQVIGVITDAVPSTRILGERPLDLDVVIPGDHNAGEWITFTHTLEPEPQTLHPTKVYSQDGTLLGVGKYATYFGGEGTASFGMFGDGSDGDLIVKPAETAYTDDTRAALGATANAGQPALTLVSTGIFTPSMMGDEVLIIQMQGTGAGSYEFGTIAGVEGTVFTLTEALSNAYTVGGNSKAQVLRVPNYRNVTMQDGGTLTAHAWDGSTGGVLTIRVQGVFTGEEGSTVSMDGKGYRGGLGGPTQDGSYGYKGEGHIGPSYQRSTDDQTNNGSGGGAGAKQSGYPGGGGAGGGGHGTRGLAGATSWGPFTGFGGDAVGTTDLSVMHIGGGGGGGALYMGGTAGAGGNGGGMIYIAARELYEIGTISSSGSPGDDSNPSYQGGGGGGGAGGTIYLLGSIIHLRADLVTAPGGAGGDGHRGDAEFGADGGQGGEGRIRIEYSTLRFSCSDPCRLTNPVPSMLHLPAEYFDTGLFGDGSDGDLLVPTGAISYTDNVRQPLSATASAGQNSLNMPSTSGFNIGDEVFVIQIRGVGTGDYEFVTISGVNANNLVLEQNLEYTYTVGGQSKAQVIRVPHYQNLTIQEGGELTVHPWDGSTGGVLVVRVNGTALVEDDGVIDGTGLGFRVYPTIVTGAGSQQYQGESYDGTWAQSNSANYTAGGGGKNETGDNAYDAKGAGGGGHATAGGSSYGAGGATVGQPDLSQEIHFGGAGGHGGHDWRTGGGTTDGSNGGGIMIIFARHLNTIGSVKADGESGRGRQEGGNGGGAGGSIYLVADSTSVSGGRVSAVGGIVGCSRDQNGGVGGQGRIRVEYGTLAGTTNPPASMEQVSFYIIEQVEEAPYTTARLNLPEAFTGGRTYQVQYGRRLVFTNTETLTTTLRVPVSAFGSATLDALVSDVGTGPLTFTLDVGNDGSWEWEATRNITGPVTLSSPDLAAAFNQYWADQGSPSSGTLDVPVQVYLSQAGQVLLTNLYVPPIPPDVAVTVDDITFGVSPTIESEIVPVTVTLHNLGGANTGGLTAAFYAPALGGQETYVGSVFVPNIPPSGTIQTTLLWNTLGFTGTLPVRIVADPYNRLTEGDEENNEASADLTILTRPDLWVPQMTLSDDEPVVGETVTVTLTLRNGGQATAGAQTVALYQGSPDAGELLGDHEGSPLQGGVTTTITFTWIPTATGDHRLFAVSDQDDTVNEFDEGNNQTWRDVYVGFGGPLLLDSGAAADEDDPAHTKELGYGYVDEGWPDVATTCDGGTLPEETLRRDPGGRVVYRFDHLLPGHFYHLDVTLYECDLAGRQESVYVDGNMVAGPEDLLDGEVHYLSLLLDPALYADYQIVVSIEAPGVDGAVVSEVNLYDVDYRYADAGGTPDPDYSSFAIRHSQFAYGWLDGVAQTNYGTLPYQSVRVNQNDVELRYQFDGLDPLKQYNLRLTFWQPDGASRVQKIQIDGQDAGLTVDTGDYQVHQETVAVPLSAYIDDGSIVVGIVRLNAESGAMVNQIAMEEQTRTPEGQCVVQETPYRSDVYGGVVINGELAPMGTVVEAFNPHGDVVGCFVVDNAGQYGFMPVYGEDATANPPIPGMRDGEQVLFKVNGALAVATPPFDWHDDHDVHRVDLGAGGIEGQSILLEPGWNLFSPRVESPAPSVSQFLSAIAGCYDLVLGENGVYTPTLPDIYNSLRELHAGLGYFIRITCTTSLNAFVQGTSQPVTTPIPLHEGWNWVGYLPTTTLPITVALQSIEGHYQRVQSLDKTYEPGHPFNTLWETGPGQGYMIYANDVVTLTYSSTFPKAASLREGGAQRAAGCNGITPTPYLTVVYGQVMVNGGPAQVGTRVEVVTPRSEVAGCFIVERPGQFGFAHVYGEDATANPPIGGFRAGEPLAFRVNGLPVESLDVIRWRDDRTPRAITLSASVESVYLPLVVRE